LRLGLGGTGRGRARSFILKPSVMDKGSGWYGDIGSGCTGVAVSCKMLMRDLPMHGVRCADAPEEEEEEDEEEEEEDKRGIGEPMEEEGEKEFSEFVDSWDSCICIGEAVSIVSNVPSLSSS